MTTHPAAAVGLPVAGALLGRVLDDAIDRPLFTFGRTNQYAVRPSAAIAVAVGVAAVAGVQVPTPLLLLAGGALASEVIDQTGDDLTQLVRGMTATAPAATPALPPAPTAAAFAPQAPAFAQPPYYPDPYLTAVMDTLGRGYSTT